MSAVTLRPVAEADLPLLADMLGELDGVAPPSTEQVEEAWRAMQRFPDYTAYLAIHEGVAIGTLSLIVFPVLNRAARFEAIAEAVVIRPAYRGQGLGRAMLKAAMALAAQKGAYKLALSSNLRRLDAHRFYERMGFARHGYSFSITTTDSGA